MPNRVAILGILGAFTAFAVPPALAQQIPAPEGSIVVTRDVGPRSAIHPGGDEVYAVRTAPTESIEGFGGDWVPITDEQASAVIGTPGIGLVGSADGPTSALPMGIAADGSLIAQNNATGSLGGTISGAVDGGMRVLDNALSPLTGSGQ